MKGDFTRSTFKPEKKYSSVRMQQGRVQLDSDWNEQMDITLHRIEKEARDIIGLCGAPLDENGGGFKIEPTSKNLTISQGRIYVDGILCENPNNINITNQEDLTNYENKFLGFGKGIYIAYLDVWQRHITAIEDPQIREVALGGPDTATRTKTIWQVKLELVQEEIPKEGEPLPCEQVYGKWKEIVKERTCMLAALTSQKDSIKKPCIVSPDADYRRLENQLYRVEIHEGGEIGTAKFKWSRDNGSIVFAIEKFLSSDKKQPTNKLKLKQLGRDKTLSLKAGDWVEVLDDDTELSETPSGTLLRITEDPDITGNVITLSQNIPVSAIERHPKIRRWDQQGDNIPVVTSVPFELEDSGIFVHFSGNDFRTGDYWLIPARTATGKIEWPLDANNEPLPMLPEGITHHYGLLAILKQDNGQWTRIGDCRKLFPAATDLTSFSYVGGDGQEAMPDEWLPEPLQVSVSNGGYPVKDALVRFDVISGNGILSAENPVSKNPLIVKTGYKDANEGVAKCKLKLGKLDPYSPNISPQLVEARLLDACHNPINISPIRFSANLSLASQVAYTLPDCAKSPETCPKVYAYIPNFNDDTVSIIDIATNKVATVNVGSHPVGVAVSPDETKVYITNIGDVGNRLVGEVAISHEIVNILNKGDNLTISTGTVSVIDTATKTVKATVPVGKYPAGVAVSPDGKKVYVLNAFDGTVSIIDTATNTVATSPVPVGEGSFGIAVSPDGKKVYVTNSQDDTVSIIDTATNTVATPPVPVGKYPAGIAVSPDGKKVYVTSSQDDTVSIIETATNTVATPPVPVGWSPRGVAVSPDGKNVYVTNFMDNTVSIIDTATNTVVAPPVPVGEYPLGIAVSPYEEKVYVTNSQDDTVSIIQSNGDIDNVIVGKKPIAIGQFIVPATNFCTINIVSSIYQHDEWGYYPLIDLFGEKEVPLLSNNDPIWESHVDKIAKLILDSKECTLKAGEKFDMGQGYALEAVKVEDGKKVLLEFTKDGQHVNNQQVSVDSGDKTWTYTLDIQNVKNVPVMKVHVNQISGDTVQIDGLWLIDYLNARTLNIGDKSGEFALTKINSGIGESTGSLIFKRITNAHRFPTVKTLFEQKINCWPPKNEAENISIKGVLDTFLCDFNAACLPVGCDLCTILDNPGVKTVQDALNVLCKGIGEGGGCCIVVQDSEQLQKVLIGLQAEELKGGRNVCLLAGEYSIKETIVIRGQNNIVIRGCNLASKLIANIEIINCQNVVIKDLDVLGNVSVKGENSESTSKNVVIKNLNVSGSIFVEYVNNFSLIRNEISQANNQDFKVRFCSDVVIESNSFREKGVELKFENLNCLKFQKNKIYTDTLDPDTSGHEGKIKFLSVVVVDSNDIEIIGNLVTMYRSTAKVIAIGLGLERVYDHTSVVSNYVHVTGGFSVEINSTGPVWVHGNYFQSIHFSQETIRTVEIISPKDQIIFTDNLCDSQISVGEKLSYDSYLINIMGKSTIFSNNHCAIKADSRVICSQFTAHVYIHIPNESGSVANLMGNRCHEENLVGTAIFSIYVGEAPDYAAEDRSLLLGNIYTNKILPNTTRFNLPG